MSKIAILTDTSSDLPDEILTQYPMIHVVPLIVRYGQREYRDRLEIQPKDIYANLKRDVPQTSLPDGCDIQAAFDQIKSEGYDHVICIMLSSALSGTFNQVRLMAQVQEGIEVTMVDSRALSMALGAQVFEAAKAIDSGENVAQIVERVESLRKSMFKAMAIKTLDYLRKGGRIGKVEGVIGTILGIKPVISVGDDGAFVTLSKARGFNQAIKEIVSLFSSAFAGKTVNAFVVYSDDDTEAKSLLAKVGEIAQVALSYVVQVGPAMGIHAGPGLVGLIAYEV